MSENSKSKKALTSALAIGLAAVMTIGGGTFAYLQGETEEVKNDFTRNKVMVDLVETKGPNFSIIPGTTAEKDPKVTVDNTVDAYAFVEITDATEGLVNYELADGWTKLDGYDNVYYREVAADAADKEFSVLKNDTVSYDASLTNTDMVDADGNLKPNVALTFKAYAIQQEPFANAKAAWLQVPADVATRNEFVNAIKEGKSEVVLNEDIPLTISATTITNDIVIDLNNHTLTGAKYKSALDIKDAKVTIKNGTLEATPNAAGSALYAEGNSNVVVDNCTVKTNGNKTYAVCTNGAKSLDTTIVITNSTISAPNVAGKKGYALYAPAGNITFKNCDVTGHIFISGGNVTLDGGTYTATGFNGQTKIWNKADTVSYAKTMTGGNAYTMGDSILIADRRDGYILSGLTIKNITFNTEITLKDGTPATVYAIKYVDMNANGAASRVPYVIENNTFNNQIDGADPVMYIDLDGNDIA